MTFRNHQTGAAETDGRASARRFVFLLLIAAALATPAAAHAESDARVNVHSDKGLYTVRALFHVAAPMDTVIEVLTDYDGIPRFMPEVRTSIVRERGENRALVEQEATARFMMFSRRIHLVLDIQEAGSTIGFRDQCGQSFSSYEGSWTLTAREGGTEIEYVLAARPSFDVPGFLLSRLLKRDSTQMIEQLEGEIAARARAASSLP